MKSRSWVLLGVGAVLIGGTFVLMNYLNRPPVGDDARIPFDEAAFERGMEQLRKEKFRCEELIRNSIKKDRPHIEAIVKEVEKQGLAEDQSAEFSFPKGGSP